jgi:CBS domain-containing protein
MRISAVMTRDICCIDPEATLEQAARDMRDQDVGSIPVARDGKPIGMLTDRDIAIRAVAEGRDPRATQVREVMTGDAVCCREDEAIEDAAELMENRQIRRLLVIDREGALCGIVSLGDLAVRGGDEKLTEEVLEEVSQPGHARS